MPWKTRRFLLVLGVIALAAGLRLANLTWRSLDGDEGASLYFSSLSLPALMAGFANLSLEPHPQLYYVFLKGWRALAGEADAALRLFSVLPAVVTVAFTYRIGKWMLGWRAAAFAALLAALSPLLVTEAQDVRMYSLSLCFSAIAFWGLLHGLRRAPARAMPSLGVFVAAVLASGYSHFNGGMLMMAAGLVTLLELRRAGRTGWLAMGAVALAGLLYLPYLVNLYSHYGAGAVADRSAPAWLSYFEQAGKWLAVYNAPLLDHTALALRARWALLGALVVLAGIGTVRAGAAGRLLAVWLLPQLLLTLYILMGYGYVLPKPLVFVAVPLALLCASAVMGCGRRLTWWSGLLAVSVVSVHLYGLAYLWRPGYQREDFRNAARFVSLHATSEDAVLVHLSWYNFVFGHYYPGPFVHPLGSDLPSAAVTGERLQALTTGEALWLVQAGVGQPGQGDPDRFVEAWLGARYPVITEIYPSGVDVIGYAVNYRTARLPPSATPAEVIYPNGLTLRGYRVPQRQFPANDLWLHPPSTWVHVTLYWSVTQPLPEDVRVAVTLEDRAGRVWGGDLPRANDLRAFYPPARWQPGEIIRQDFDVNTNPVLKPGDYKVVLRVYPAGSNTALLVPSGNNWSILSAVNLSR